MSSCKTVFSCAELMEMDRYWKDRAAHKGKYFHFIRAELMIRNILIRKLKGPMFRLGQVLIKVECGGDHLMMYWIERLIPHVYDELRIYWEYCSNDDKVRVDYCLIHKSDPRCEEDAWFIPKRLRRCGVLPIPETTTTTVSDKTL